MEAEGNLFEVCGDKRQRQRREASRTRGDPGGAALCLGLPVPPSLHPHPASAPSPPPASYPGLARGLSHLVTPRGMADLWLQKLPSLGWIVSSFHDSCNCGHPDSQKICPSTLRPHFWNPKRGYKPLQLQHPSTSPHDLPFLGS